MFPNDSIPSMLSLCKLCWLLLKNINELPSEPTYKLPTKIYFSIHSKSFFCFVSIEIKGYGAGCEGGSQSRWILEEQAL